MQSRYWGMSLVFLLFAVAFAQPTGGNRVLVVNGRSGQAGVVQIEGRTYVDLETLVRIAEGIPEFSGRADYSHIANGRWRPLRISCGHFLAAMLGSGEINDDPSCH
jgi:hypothetical protein